MSAAIFLKKFPDAILIPVKNGASQEEVESYLEEYTGDVDVYTLDSAVQIEYLISRFSKVTTIDHHIGIKEECERLDTVHENYTFIFNNEKSGATLTWEYCFEQEPKPVLVSYVEDIDIRNDTLIPDSLFACTYIYLYTDDPHKFVSLLEAPLENIVERGALLEEANKKKLFQIIDRDYLYLVLGKELVHAYNVTDIKYLFGPEISKKINKAVLMYKIDGQKTTVSIRSQEGQSPTALDIAEELGGGGHKHAAGAAMDTFEFLGMLQKK